jgi:23S rRNA (uracil1939-C5)-methyltransferase
MQQLERKKKVLEDNIKFKDVKYFYGPEYAYRNKMDFIFGKNIMGLRKKDDFKHIIDVEECVICNEKINEMLKKVREHFKESDHFDFERDSGTFKEVILRAGYDDCGAVFILNPDSNNIKEAQDKIRNFSQESGIKNIVISYSGEEEFLSDYFVLEGDEFIKEKLLDKTFYYSLTGFFQNNTHVASKMQDHCNSLLKKYDTKNAFLLDLYAGVGTFGIINSELFKEVLVVESVKSCIDAANKNIIENNAKNVKTMVLDAGKIKRLSLKKPLYVILDPPRSGMDQKTIDELKKIKPEAIIYVSCNVFQLSKDILKFKDYKIKSAAMFDMFPQTKHIEAVVELCLK